MLIYKLLGIIYFSVPNGKPVHHHDPRPMFPWRYTDRQASAIEGSDAVACGMRRMIFLLSVSLDSLCFVAPHERFTWDNGASSYVTSFFTRMRLLKPHVDNQYVFTQQLSCIRVVQTILVPRIIDIPLFTCNNRSS